jgi:large subunit ribosomal protein L29
MSVKPIAFQDLIDTSLKDLVLMRRDLKKQLFELRMKNALKSLKETHLISILRKNVARINTALTTKINTN